MEFEFEFKAMQSTCCPCVGKDANMNLTVPQRELLLWHWKLGVSMKRVKELMLEHEAINRNKKSVFMPQVIKTDWRSNSSCPISLYTACELARTKK